MRLRARPFSAKMILLTTWPVISESIKIFPTVVREEDPLFSLS
jgi:hypothetical protein